MGRSVALILDPDADVRRTVREACAAREIDVLEAADGSEAGGRLRAVQVDLLFVDPREPAPETQELLRRSTADGASVLVVMAPDDSRDWIARGAFDVLSKPFDLARLRRVVARAERQVAVVRELRLLRERVDRERGVQELVGGSPAMERVQIRLRGLAESPAPVCFTGEPGTGKELAARTLNALSHGQEAPFVTLHGAALSDETWDRQWLGDDGALARARGGSIYVEEVPELQPALQERLEQVAAAVPRASAWRDVRILWSTTPDPRRAVDEGRLSERVWRELGREIVALPALRERVEDLRLLAHQFVVDVCRINDLAPLRLAPETLSLLERYHWPANVRELRGAMEQAVILARDGVIRPRDLPDRIQQADAAQRASEIGRRSSSRHFREAKRAVLEVFERAYLRDLMERHAGNVTAAAQQAGMLRSALQRLLRRYAIRSAEFRQRPVERSPDRADHS